MTLVENHPGTDLGQWIRAKRRELRLLPSHVANEIQVSHAAYAEIELGITKWIGALQRTLLPQVLCFSTEDNTEFVGLVASCKGADPITFGQIFTKEDLTPVRLRKGDDFEAPTARETELILNEVFQDIA